MDSYGWICPKCERVYAPTQNMCLYCGPGNLGLTGISDSTAPEVDLDKYTNTTDPFKYKIDCGSTTTCDKTPSMYYNSTSATKAVCNCYDRDGEYCLGIKEPFATACKGNRLKCEKL